MFVKDLLIKGGSLYKKLEGGAEKSRDLENLPDIYKNHMQFRNVF